METKQSGGIGCLGVVQIVLIILKLTKLIAWSWWAVFTPTWVAIGLIIFVIIIAAIVVALKS